MSKNKNKIIATLVFYAEILGDRRRTKEFHKELDRQGLTYDYFYRAINEARELITNKNQ